MMTILKKQREDSENVVQLRGDGKVPLAITNNEKKLGVVLETDVTLRQDLFSNAKKFDSMNEAMPFK